MSRIDVGGPGSERGKTGSTIDALMIASCLPVLVISAVVILITGGIELGFLIAAIVCGAMIGMLTFVTIRDRTTT